MRELLGYYIKLYSGCVQPPSLNDSVRCKCLFYTCPKQHSIVVLSLYRSCSKPPQLSVFTVLWSFLSIHHVASLHSSLSWNQLSFKQKYRHTNSLSYFNLVVVIISYNVQAPLFCSIKLVQLVQLQVFIVQPYICLSGCGTRVVAWNMAGQS